MASNFKILRHQNGYNLHLKLAGDFDGSSAWELFNTMKRNCHKVSKVFINCSCLKNIDPFGQDVFRDNMKTLPETCTTFLFTGTQSTQISPEKIGVCNIFGQRSGVRLNSAA
jgi:anti-anti-sigma regulatory factor